MSSDLRRAIFLDRDGVLIEAIVRDGKPYAATTPSEVRIMAGVEQACSALASMGYMLIMITNQPDVARGKISRQFVDSTNADLAQRLNLDDIGTCLHDNFDKCDCRKPSPGLIINAASKLNIDLSLSIVVGDRWRDIEAGRNAGCKTVFIDYGYDEVLVHKPNHVAKSLIEAVDWVRMQNMDSMQCQKK